MEPGVDAGPGWGSAGGHIELHRDPARSAIPAADVIAVEDRVHRYAWAFDERRRDALGNCFALDAVWEGNTAGTEPVDPIHGRDQIADWLAGFWSRQADQRRHLMLSIVVTPHASTGAEALVSLALTAARDRELAIVLTSFYRMHVIPVDGVWRIQHLFEGFDAAF
jgi:hypothetical protein